MLVYNIVISLINVGCFFGFVICLFRSKSLYDKTPDPILKQVYFVYWVTKVIELADTVFMVLKHKFRQVSPLHVYHHATMLILSEMGYKKYAWASFAMPLTLNALVHVVLYLYYGELCFATYLCRTRKYLPTVDSVFVKISTSKKYNPYILQQIYNRTRIQIVI